MLKVGSPFHGDFVIAEILGGEGLSGEADVYLIQNSQNGQRLVAKTPQKRQMVVGEHLSWIKALNHVSMEYGALTSLKGYPYFVAPHDRWLTHHGPFVIMEYVPGTTLEARVLQRDLDFHQVVDWWIQIANAVAILRRQGVAFQDLAAQNIMVTPEGRIKIIDLGWLELTEKTTSVLEDSPEFRNFLAAMGFYGPGEFGICTDLVRFGEIIEWTFNLCYIDVGLACLGVTGEEEEQLYTERRKEADIAREAYRSRGVKFVFSWPLAPPPVSDYEDEVLDLVTELRESPSNQQAFDLDGMISRIRALHNALPNHECTVAHSEIDPAVDAAFYSNRSLAELQAGHPDRALEYVDRALRFDPDNAETCATKGHVCVAMGQPNKSLEWYRRSLSQRPSDFAVLLNCGSALVQIGKLAEAEIMLTKAQGIDENHPVLLNALGYLNEKRGDKLKARSFYLRALDQDPSYKTAKRNLQIIDGDFDDRNLETKAN